MTSPEPRENNSYAASLETDSDLRFDTDSAVWRLATELAGAVSPAAVAAALAEEGAAAAGGSFANMGILKAGAAVVLVVHHPSLEQAVALRWGEFEVNERTPMGEAIRSGLPVLIESLDAARRHFPEVLEDLQTEGLSARASFPLRSTSGEMMGAVGFGWSAPQAFDANQLRHLDLISQLTAQALERTLHLDPELWLPAPGRRTFEIGAPISPGISARWFHAIYQTPMLFSGILDDQGRVIDANFLSIEGCGLVREQTVGFPFWEGGWWSPDPDLVAATRGLCEKVLATGESLRVTTRFFVGDRSEHMAEVALYPLFDDGATAVSHIVAVGMDITDALSAQSERQARLAAEADALRRIDEARSRELSAAKASEAEMRERLARLAGAALELLHAESIHDLARIVFDRGLRVLGAEGGEIVVRESGEFRVAVSDRLLPHVRVNYERLPLDSPVPAAHVARTGETLVLADEESGIAFAPEMAHIYANTGRSAWAFVPLKVGARLLGSLAISWIDEHTPGENELGLIEAFAAQCAQALDRIRATRAEEESRQHMQQMVEAFQQSLLNRPKQSEALVLAARYLPAFRDAQVGGDWYDSFLTSDGAMLVSVGDVAGHDSDAAATMAQLRNLFRGLAMGIGAGPANLLFNLDASINNLELDAIATALVARIDAPDNSSLAKVTWSSAGHLPPMVRLANGSVAVLTDQPDLLLGVRPETARVEREFELEVGATLLMFTDGLVERRGEHLDQGLQRLAHAFGELGAQDLESLCDAIISTMVPGEPGDDVALLVMRHAEPITGRER